MPPRSARSPPRAAVALPPRHAPPFARRFHFDTRRRRAAPMPPSAFLPAVRLRAQRRVQPRWQCRCADRAAATIRAPHMFGALLIRRMARAAMYHAAACAQRVAIAPPRLAFCARFCSFTPPPCPPPRCIFTRCHAAPFAPVAADATRRHAADYAPLSDDATHAARRRIASALRCADCSAPAACRRRCPPRRRADYA